MGRIARLLWVISRTDRNQGVGGAHDGRHAADSNCGLGLIVAIDCETTRTADAALLRERGALLEIGSDCVSGNVDPVIIYQPS